MDLISPKIDVRRCPWCGEEVEFIDFELEVRCPRCGKVVRRDPSELPIPLCPRVMNCIDMLVQMGLLTPERARKMKEDISKALEMARKHSSGPSRGSETRNGVS